MFKLFLPPCPEEYGCSSVPGTWWAFRGALEPIPKSCQEWSNSWELMLPVGSLLHPPPLDNALNPLPSILPDSLSLDLRDVLLSVICQISVCFWGVLPTHWQQGLASFSVLHPLSSTLSIRSWAEVPFCIFPNLSLENTQYSAVLLSHLMISVLIAVNLVTDLCNCFYIGLFFLFYFTLNFKIILYVLSLPLLSPGEQFLLHRYIFHCNSYSWG